MRLGIRIIAVITFILGILCIIFGNQLNYHVKNIKKINTSFESFSFYKEENKDRYNEYKKNNPLLKDKDIILRVNIGLDHGFYTETKKVTNFNLLMLINKYNYVDESFIPDNLVLVDKYARDGMYLVEECKNAFIKMAQDAEAVGYTIRAISTYRTLDYQEKLYNNYVKKDGIEIADTYSARPGYSEHHTGLAIDIDNKQLSYTNFESTKEFTWMMENSYKYGFILRYGRDTSITGYMYEPWHYRYVGLEASNYIHEQNITFEEYYYEFIDNKNS